MYNKLRRKASCSRPSIHRFGGVIRRRICSQIHAQKDDVMDILNLSHNEMPPEDRDFYIEFGISSALALVIALFA
jgi:hypothetical protein